MRTIYWIIGILIGVILVVWAGKRINPRPFLPYPEESRDLGTQPLPENLPVPVERFYRTIYGNEIPIIQSFILTGRGSLRFNGITLPTRLRFTHTAGKDYRHYIETTLWGIPIMKVNEHFINLQSRLALPFGVIENEPKVDQAANLGLWSETMMFPAIYLTTPGVRWEPIDKFSATLVVPFGDQQDRFTVFFDQESGLIERMDALRWKDAGDDEKTLWQAQALAWGEVQGYQMPTLFAAQWTDESSPWLIAQIESARWNIDVSEYITQSGE